MGLTALRNQVLQIIVKLGKYNIPWRGEQRKDNSSRRKCTVCSLPCGEVIQEDVIQHIVIFNENDEVLQVALDSKCK